jgi:hypothetical protein
LSDDAFLRAQKRKLLGHPPRSPDAYTIGDEVIWELLLANLREDLIVVTRDKTYEDNLPLLKKEYQKKTGFNFLLVTEKLSEAVERIGAKPTPELIDAEKKEQESLAQASFTREWLPLLMHRWQRSFDNFYSFSHYNKLLFPDAALESGTAVGNLGLIDSDIKK